MWKVIYFVVVESIVARSQLNVCEIYDVMKIQKRVESCQKYVLEVQNFVLQLIVTMWQSMQSCNVVSVKQKWKKKRKEDCEDDE